MRGDLVAGGARVKRVWLRRRFGGRVLRVLPRDDMRHILIQVTPEILEHLREKAQARKMTVIDYIRWCCERCDDLS